MAGAAIKESTVEEAEKLLMSAIDNYIDNKDSEKEQPNE